jgi:hypothetical protein
MIMPTRIGKVEDADKMKTTANASRRTTGLSALIAFALLAGAAGCGQLSFMEVTVRVDNTVAAVNSSCLYSIDRCEVRVSGAESDFFTLGAGACVHRTVFDLAEFQFGTDESSGNISFHIEIFDANGNKLGQGDGAGAIKDGGRQPVIVPVAPDAAAFAATGGCSPP